MASNEKSGGPIGFLFGVGLLLLALAALYTNEVRFDFHEAASNSTEVTSVPSAAQADGTISLTGAMDQGLTLDGEVVDSFTGYMQVRRSAEIYSWVESTDSENRTEWDLQWTSSVESNSRNAGITQQYRSATFTPPTLEVGDLSVDTDDISFVDGAIEIAPGSLQLQAAHQQLSPAGAYFSLSKGNPDRLGDERIRYTGVLVPATATWFGVFDGTQGVADRTNARDGFVNSLIGDTGLVHHIAAGDRSQALDSIGSQLRTLMWVVRGVGTAGSVFGVLLMVSPLFRLLMWIPIVGRIAEASALILAIAIGVPLALLAMTVGFLVANPLILLLLLAALGGAAYFFTQRARSKREGVQADVRAWNDLPPAPVQDAAPPVSAGEQELFALVRHAMLDDHLSAAELRDIRALADRTGHGHRSTLELVTLATSTPPAAAAMPRVA